ncbi:hypothetical protein [Bacillus weihaiensis]|uniref:hypothetical protein n=1 Tax=Bacillus weihaiensis TaxID=1547283 RepID=UPI002352EC33|nr:hypothetical protein [Bacillus weihaiensis]
MSISGCTCYAKGKRCLYCRYCSLKKIKLPNKVIAACWSCNKVEDISDLPADLTSKHCECGGYIITPSGKIQAIWLGERA